MIDFHAPKRNGLQYVRYARIVLFWKLCKQEKMCKFSRAVAAARPVNSVGGNGALT